MRDLIASTFKYAKLGFKNQTALLVIYLSLITLKVTLTVISPIFFANMIDSLASKKFDDAYTWGSIYLSIGFIGILISFYDNKYVTMFIQKCQFQLHNHILNFLKSISPRLIQNNFAFLSEQIKSDVNQVVSFLITNSIPLIFHMIKVSVIFSLIFLINKKIFIILFTIVPLYLISYKWFKTKLQELSLAKKTSQNEYDSTITKQLLNIRFIKTQGIGHLTEKELFEKHNNNLNHTLNYAISSYKFGAVGTFFSILANTVAILLSIHEIKKGNMTIGQIGIIFSYFNQALRLIESIFVSFSSSMVNFNISTKRLDLLFKSPIEKQGDLFENVNEIKVLKTEASEKVELVFKPGNIYSLTGPNGTGKSTILREILSCDKFPNIEVYINQKPIESFSLNLLREKQIAYLEQNPSLYFENLNDYFSSDISNTNESFELLKQKILSLPNENGKLDPKELSIGQIQLLNIYKNLTSKKKVFLLDEPTSSIDKESKELLCNVLRSMARSGSIIIISTHEKGIKEVSDHIITIDQKEKATSTEEVSC